MNIRRHILLAALCACAQALAFTGCEEVVDPNGLPYVERLVVHGTISPGIPVDSIFIRRTLPLDIPYDSRRAIVPDAAGYIETDGERFPLVSKGEGRYAVPDLVPQSGRRYTLVADWHGKHITASTTVPSAPAIDTVYAHEASGYPGQPTVHDSVVAIVSPRANEVYALEAYDSFNQGYEYSRVIDLEYDGIVEQSSSTKSDGRVHLIYHGYPVHLQRGVARIIVHAFDAPFHDFFYSYYRRFHSDDFLEIDNGQVYWNVEGDGIGMFIGKAISSRTLK